MKQAKIAMKQPKIAIKQPKIAMKQPQNFIETISQQPGASKAVLNSL
jgi:hypothetical protein